MLRTAFFKNTYRYVITITLLLLAVSSELHADNSVAEQNEKILRIYQDADLSRHGESGISIQRGIEVAFDEINNTIQGYKIDFRYLDHRGNVVLSKKNIQTYLDDPSAIALFSGIHSPPLIKNRSFINEYKALILVPWAAGGPLTRHPSPENWIFRLSIDDTRAAKVLIDYAKNEKYCAKPTLLLEKTRWGDSNLENMENYFSRLGVENYLVERFNLSLSEESASALLNRVMSTARDCLIYVGNAVEGSVIAKSMINMPLSQRIPIISHWGITGGDFHVKVNSQDREKIDLSFIQSCFSFTSKSTQNKFSTQVFERLKKLYPDEIRSESDLKSAAGFIHAYDLTRLLIQAIKQTELSGKAEADRNTIRIQLENIQKPIRGLVKTYRQPFSIFDSVKNPNAHEALGPEFYCMGEYGDKNEVLLISSNH